MSALVNTAGQYKVGANMLQAKDISGKGKLTGFHDFFVLPLFKFCLTILLKLPPSLRPSVQTLHLPQKGIFTYI